MIVAEWKNVSQISFLKCFHYNPERQGIAINPSGYTLNQAHLAFVQAMMVQKQDEVRIQKYKTNSIAEVFPWNFFYNIFHGVTGGNLYYSACEKDFHTSVYMHLSSSIVLINLVNI